MSQVTDALEALQNSLVKSANAQKQAASDVGDQGGELGDAGSKSTHPTEKAENATVDAPPTEGQNSKQESAVLADANLAAESTSPEELNNLDRVEGRDKKIPVETTTDTGQPEVDNPSQPSDKELSQAGDLGALGDSSHPTTEAPPKVASFLEAAELCIKAAADEVEKEEKKDKDASEEGGKDDGKEKNASEGNSKEDKESKEEVTEEPVEKDASDEDKAKELLSNVVKTAAEDAKLYHEFLESFTKSAQSAEEMAAAEGMAPEVAPEAMAGEEDTEAAVDAALSMSPEEAQETLSELLESGEVTEDELAEAAGELEAAGLVPGAAEGGEASPEAAAEAAAGMSPEEAVNALSEMVDAGVVSPEEIQEVAQEMGGAAPAAEEEVVEPAKVAAEMRKGGVDDKVVDSYLMKNSADYRKQVLQKHIKAAAKSKEKK